jgi:hypothetical protein
VSISELCGPSPHRGQTCQEKPTRYAGTGFQADGPRKPTASGFLGDDQRQTVTTVRYWHIPDKDEVPGSNPGRPTPKNPVPAGVFTISDPSESVFRGGRGQTRGQTCQASAKKTPTAKPFADTSRWAAHRPFQSGSTSATQRLPAGYGRG